MSEIFSVSEWPPKLTKEEEEYITKVAIDYTFSTSLCYRDYSEHSSTAISAPFSLFPSPFPRDKFDLAKRIQPLYNKLYMRIANDHDFLSTVIGGAVAKVDSFQAELWSIYSNIKKMGCVQPISLGIFRSDYLLDASESSLTLKQVEMNTISVGSVSLGPKTTKFHKYLLNSGFYPSHPSLSKDAIPDNDEKICINALAQAHKLYGNTSACVLMVVQPNEPSIFDQKDIEIALLNDHGIRVLRATFDELESYASLEGPDRRLVLKGIPFTTTEISVVYFRAGYSPKDYKSLSNWSARFLLESSKAIKCPSVALQLAGAKKVQQVLASPGILEKFLDSEEEVALLRATFTRLFPLDDSDNGKEAMRLIKESNGEGFVLKPQREGGGNNIYGAEILKALSEMAERDKTRSNQEVYTEREGYILMDLIKSPKNIKNIHVNWGATNGILSETIGELGIYGSIICNNSSTRPEIYNNETGGHILRTKAYGSQEGGIMIGYSVSDSPLLIS